MAYDIERWRQKMLKKLANQSTRSKATALASHNLDYGAGLTQSGGYTSAAENIARGEALEAAGVNEEAAQMQHERQLELDAIAAAKKEAEKARKQQMWQSVLGLGLNIAGAPLLAGGTSLLGAGLSKIGLGGMKQAEQTVAGTLPPAEIPMSQTAPVAIPAYQAPVQTAMAQQYAPQGGVNDYFGWMNKLRRKKPASPYNVQLPPARPFPFNY